MAVLPGRTSALRDLGAALGLGLLCVAILGPDRFLPGAPAIGRPTRDLFDHLWLLDHWSLRAPALRFPEGGRLVPPDPTGMLLATPLLRAGLDRALAWNLAVLAQLWFACLAGLALGRRMGAGPVGAVAFGLSPYLLGQAVSGEGETLAAWPLAACAALLLRGGSRARVAAGLVAAVAGIASWYHGVFAGLLLVVFALADLLNGRGPRRALLAPLAAALAIAPAAAVYAWVLQDPGEIFRGPTMADYLAVHRRALAGMVSDPAAWLAPARAAGGHVDRLGVAVVVLALLGSRARWWVLTALALVLSLGPIVHVHGAPVLSWAPYRLLVDLPALGLMRLPHRFTLLATLGLAAMAARGARRFPWLGAALVLADTLVFSPMPRAATPVTTAPEVAAWPDGPVLDLPLRTLGRDDARGRALVDQAAHRQPVAVGLLMRPLADAVAREPLVIQATALDRWDALPDRPVEADQFGLGAFARAVAAARRRPLSAGELAGAAERLRGLGYRNAMLHLDRLGPEDRERIEAMLTDVLGPPARRSDRVVLWRL